VEKESRSRTAIGVIARAPSAPGKTRLASHIPEARLRSLRTALVADVLHVVSALDEVERFIFFTPDEADAEIAALARGSFTLRPQRGDGLGQRMRSAFEELLIDRAYGSVILIGSDIPLLTAEHVAAARERLRTTGDIVLGPADDGGYYLIGLRTAESRLFDAIEWGTASVFSDTVAAATRSGLTARIIQPAYDVDTIEDLRRLEQDLVTAPPELAPNTRAWFESRLDQR
jgi:rSAM/selenodomain-associated transferase 1